MIKAKPITGQLILILILKESFIVRTVVKNLPKILFLKLILRAKNIFQSFKSLLIKRINHLKQEKNHSRMKSSALNTKLIELQNILEISSMEQEKISKRNKV